MTAYQKTALLHKIHAWSSLLLNCFISSLALVIQRHDFSMLIGFGFLFIVAVLWVVNRISYDMRVNDISKTSIIFTYLCILALALIMICVTYINLSRIVALIVASATAVEILIAVMIQYRYPIKRRLKTGFRKNG